jgi:methylated-DNA-[protein]-cysteine S-methyltransferase
MGANPVPLIVPCHRVLAADGRTGGFSSPGGVRAKMEMLALEKAASPTGQFSFGF